MDERQGQLKDRAGLDESRINEDFRDFLVKWGPRLLIVVALVALAFSGRRWLTQKADERTDEAFVQLALATGTDTTSPDTLLSLAEQYDDVGAVAQVARLTAAEAYLSAVRRGLVIGAQPDAAGQYPENELLDDELRTSYLRQASQAAQAVTDDDGTPDVLLVRGFMIQAAVGEALGEPAVARANYERAAELDRAMGYGTIARIADARAAGLDALATRVVLPASASLPRPEPAVPEQRDEDDPFGLGGLDFGDLGGGLFDEPAPVDAPVSEHEPQPEPAPTQDPGR